MKKIFAKFKGDRGVVTLAEMAMTSAILIALLGVVYNFGFFVEAVYNADRQRSDTVANTSTALNIFDKYLSQNILLETYTPYNVTFLTDTNSDNKAERWVFVLDNSSHTIRYTRYNTNTLRQNTTVQYRGFVAYNVYNIDYNTPLFKYFNSDGTEITNPDKIQSDARSMQVNMLIRPLDISGKNPRFKVSRYIFFRNRGL